MCNPKLLNSKSGAEILAWSRKNHRSHHQERTAPKEVEKVAGCGKRPNWTKDTPTFTWIRSLGLDFVDAQ
jgi:hypothetical protein